MACNMLVLLLHKQRATLELNYQKTACFMMSLIEKKLSSSHFIIICKLVNFSVSSVLVRRVFFI